MYASHAYTTDMLDLGKFIRQRRLASGMSLRAFANGADISPSHQSDIENGRRFPSEAVLRRIASRLNVSWEEVKRHDSRLDEDVYSWIQSTPEAIEMLRAVRRQSDNPKETLRQLSKLLEQLEEGDLDG